MPGLANINGVISGLQTDDIISKILQYKQRPIDLLNQKKAGLTEKLTAWQSMNARLLAVQLKAADLQSASAFAIKTAVSSNTDALTATASDTATAGTYTLKITQLAKAHQLGSADNYSSASTVGVGSGSISIKNVSSGQSWTIDITTDANSLENVRDAINAAGTDAVANIVNDGTANPYRLVLTSKLTGTSGELEVTTNLSGGEGLNFVGPNSVITPPDNALVQLGSGATPISISNSTNIITGLIPGVTLNLARTTPSDSLTLTVRGDGSGIIKRVQDFIGAYNSLMDFIKSSAGYDADIKVGGPLLGDFALQTIQGDMAGLINRNVTGLTGAVSALSSVGIRMGSDGKLSLDESILSQQLTTDSSAVARVFGRSGTASDASISFLSATANAKESVGLGYAVNITQLATQTRVTAGHALAGLLAQPETLKINGVDITLNTGMSLASIVSTINSKSISTGVVASATLADGTGSGTYLTLKSTAYGSAAQITAISNIAGATSGSTGIGTLTVTGSSPEGDNKTGTGAEGLDVAGTINGETATGRGKILTGMSGNASTSGFSILVNSTTTGQKGYVTYSRGTAAGLNDLLSTFTDVATGLVTTQEQGIQTELDSLNGQLNSLIDRLGLEETRIREQFAAMEAALGKLQSQGQYLTAVIKGLQNNNMQ